MSTILVVRSDDDSSGTISLVKSAIDSEIARLELAVQMAEDRLRPFEDKYNVSSTEFMESWAAEDLEGGDEEYVQWAGEFGLKIRLLSKLEKLRDIVYDSANTH